MLFDAVRVGPRAGTSVVADEVAAAESVSLRGARSEGFVRSDNVSRIEPTAGVPEPRHGVVVRERCESDQVRLVRSLIHRAIVRGRARMVLQDGLDVWSHEMEAGRRVSATPRLESVSVKHSLGCRDAVTAVIVVEGITGVPDVGDRAGISDGVECLDRIPPAFQQDAVRHRRATVDTHVAVHQQNGIRFAKRLGRESQSVIEPDSGCGNPSSSVPNQP